jgi:hypothetical protein
MSMKKAAALAVIVLVAVAYLAGYWPQHRQLTEARAQVEQLQSRLDAAEARLSLAEVLGQLLRLSDADAAKNYGEAAALSSSFFDAVRAEASRTTSPDTRTVLEDILNTRDRVTTAIAATDPMLGQVLDAHEGRLRQALGFPIASS